MNMHLGAIRMNSRRHLNFFLASLLFIIPYYAQASDGFPVSQKIAEQVWFWEGIFSKFDSNTMIIHDTFYPQIIVDVVNFEIFAKKFNRGQKYSRQKKSTIIKKYIKCIKNVTAKNIYSNDSLKKQLRNNKF